MKRTSTPLLKLSDIDIENIDLVADAYGIDSQYTEVFQFLSLCKFEPGNKCVESLLRRSGI